MSKRVLFLITGYLGTAVIVYQLFTDQRPVGSPTVAAMAWLGLPMLPGVVRLVLLTVVAPWNDLAQRRRDARVALSGRGSDPLVSVIVPAWNEEVGIRRTVESVLASTYPRLEVVVVNDGSTDRTHEVVLDLLAEVEARGEGATLVYRRQANGGKSSALNHGLAVASGEILMTVDADSVVEPDAVSRIVDRFADPEVMCVSGNVKIGNPGSVLGMVQRLEYLMGFFSKNADALLHSIYIVGGAAAAYRRSVLEAVGPFAHDIITEDIEMSTRIQDAGYRVDYAPRAIVWTEGPSELAGLAKQRLRWKHGRLVTFSRYRHLFFSLRRRHSRWLAWVTLPLAVIGDLLLFLEWFMLAFALWFAFSHHDYLPLATYLAAFAVIAALPVLLDPRPGSTRAMLWLAPVAWLPVLVVDAVELQALVRSLVRLARGKELTWQKWQRRGVFDASTSALPAGSTGR